MLGKPRARAAVMFGSSLRTSSAIGWALSAAAVPVLYILSVGAIWYADGMGKLRDPLPGWMVVYCRPFLWLQDETPLKTPLQEFALWCHQKGGQSAKNGNPGHP
jgi:hypothetical protein